MSRKSQIISDGVFDQHRLSHQVLDLSDVAGINQAGFTLGSLRVMRPTIAPESPLGFIRADRAASACLMSHFVLAHSLAPAPTTPAP